MIMREGWRRIKNQKYNQTEIQDKIGDIGNSKVKTILRKLWQTDIFVYCLFNFRKILFVNNS